MKPFLPSILTLLPILLSLPAPATATLTGTLINNCPYPIYAKTTRGGGYDSFEMFPVAPHGGRYHASVHAHANGAGVTIKAQLTPDPSWPDVYQIEYAQSDTPYTRDGHGDWAWYDLSTVDGSPFQGEWRRMEVRARGKGKGSKTVGGMTVRGNCKVLECAPGSGDCEWPVPEQGVMGDCRAGRKAEVLVTLCRKASGAVGDGGGGGAAGSVLPTATTIPASSADSELGPAMLFALKTAPSSGVGTSPASSGANPTPGALPPGTSPSVGSPSDTSSSETLSSDAFSFDTLSSDTLSSDTLSSDTLSSDTLSSGTSPASTSSASSGAAKEDGAQGVDV